MYSWINQQLHALKRLTIGIFAIAAALLMLSHTAQAQCPQTLNDIQWASPDPSNPLTVSKLLAAGSMNCQTPIYFGLHRGSYTRAMDLDTSNHPIPPNLGLGQASGQGLASPTVIASPSGTFPVFPQSLAAVAIPAYQNYLSSNNGHLPTSIDPTGTLTVQQGKYSAWPAIIELDPRQDSTGTWYLFHGVYTNSDALTPDVDPNDPNQKPTSTAQATLANDQLLYRAAPLAQGYVGSSSAPSIDRMATAQEILDQIMTDPSVNMVLQLHTRTYSDTLNFYTWLLQTWAPGHSNEQIVNVIGRIFFCVDLNKMTPKGQGSTGNDYKNLGFLSSWNSAVLGILSDTQSKYPNVPTSSLPPVALMVNLYDDTNLTNQNDVANALLLLQVSQSYTVVKYLGLEITDENSPINPQLESLGQMAKSQLGMQIGKSVLTSDHFISVTDSNGNPAVKYGATKSEAPTSLITGNNAVINGTPFQQLWADNQSNLVDLNYSLSFQLGVQDTQPTSSMSVYDPADNTGTALTQVQPTIVLSDLPLIHSAKQNGEVRAVFSGTYTHDCAQGYPGCNDPNNPGQSTYQFATSEGNLFSFTGDRNVAFGANGNFRYATVVNGPIACVRDNFPGPDPAPGVVKACYVSPPIAVANTVYCGDEGETCTYTERAEPWMAANGNALSASFFLHPGGFSCKVSTFWEDPAKTFRKACFYEAFSQYLSPVAGPAGYTFCAGENGSCPFKGLGRVAFGANGKFNYSVLNGGVSCDNATLGPDPARGYTKSCFYQVITAVSGATDIDLGSGPPAAGGNSTCDIYASGGTPCVAAHSTVRALFGAYNGRLYQVQRASDSMTRDIGTVATGGYADTASQDSFCAGTTCIITMIYDQSSQHNDLSIEGPGGAVHTADSGAVANALPISLNGNGNKVYGVKVTPGVGYRNNATSGIAKGGSPEGMYMVTSGTYVNKGCCFDYGNVESNSQDTGNGHMDALNFGTACVFGPCSGSGPWVEADLENGQYMGNGSNLGAQSVGYDFVTAMLKNNGQTTFALKAGNAKAGGLTTEYSGTLPTIKSGYIPMNLAGGVVLGTGGDNSNWGQGSFFEGAMTSGYPTDDTENAVQANIVAAGYGGDSSGGSAGSGGSGVSEPPGPYTGPSDPDGPGPQDGFASPATEQPNDIMKTKPAFASFNGSLYLAFMGFNVNNDLYVASSSSGTNFPTATQYTNIQSSSAPSMAAFGNRLYLAFRGLNVDNDFYITSSSTGSGFPTATRYTNIQMGGAPALAEFNYQLCASFQANDGGHSLHVTCSSDGTTWPTAWDVPNVKIGSDPAMTVFNGKLYVAFRANDPSNDVWIASSSDGHTFTSQKLTGQTMGGNSAPALVASNGVLYYIYGANDSDNEMLVSSSTDGSTWQGPKAYLDVKMGVAGPGAAAFGNGVSVGFQSNDSRNVLFVTSKVTEASTYTGPNDPGGPGPQDAFASPASEQSNDVMKTKPALVSFNDKLYAAFMGFNVNNDLYVVSSSSGSNFPTATQYTNIQMSSAPSMAAFNKRLYVAFRGLNVNNDFYITSSSTGADFPTATQYTNIQMGGAPALAVFNNQLCAAFQANDAGHSLHVTCSSDGTTWPTAWDVSNVKIGSDPAMAAYNGKLYVAFKADDASNDVWIASSSDGHTFTSQVLPGQTMGGSSSPALAVSTCTLYYIYGANDQANEMLVSASTDGSAWQGPAAYLDVKMGAAGPGAAAFGNGVSVGFQSNDSRHVLFITSGVGGLGGNPTSCK